MAQFTGKKIDITKINGGQEIADGSGVTPELLNAPVNSALYTEKAIDILTSQVDTSEMDGTGTPSVSFVQTVNGQETYKYLKFKNLKGAKGEQGKEGKQGRSVKKLVQSGADLIVEYDDGTSQTMVGAIQALTELPIVSVDDFGKILVVNQDGKWAVGDAPEGGGGGKNIQSIVIEGTSFIVTYIDGSVETVEIDTQNTVVATPEDVAGGGTTLNKYTLSGLSTSKTDQMKLLCKIVKECKGKIMLSFVNYGNMPASCIYGDNNDINVFISGVGIVVSKTMRRTVMLTINSSTGYVTFGHIEQYTYADNTTTVADVGSTAIRCIYFNDTEITA